MANQYSIEMLKRQLKEKNRLIKTLEARVASAAESARSQVSGEIEFAQLANKKEIEVLKTKLEQANSTIRDGRVQSDQQRDMITQLQAQLEVTKARQWTSRPLNPEQPILGAVSLLLKRTC
jgi:predicted RNase H-like nuclease (RuvC/YqgF family)